MQTDVIYNQDFMKNNLPDHCADLIIADPPYYRVKGEFDQVWDTFEDYLADVAGWAEELARVLSFSGTLVWFGSHRNIAYCQVILDRHFHLLNNCTVEKRNSIQNKFACPDTQRSFFSNDERFLLYENDSEEPDRSLGGKAKNHYKTRLGLMKSQCVKPVIDYLNAERERAGFSAKQVNEALGTCMASHWFTHKSQFELPRPEWYRKLRDLFNSRSGGGKKEYLQRDYGELKNEYDALCNDWEVLRKDCEELRRPFFMEGRQSDIFSLTVDSGASYRIGHPTVKDMNLIRLLVRCLSREGQTVLEPFAGSGTGCLAAAEYGRKYIGYEIDTKYWKIATERLGTVQTMIG